MLLIHFWPQIWTLSGPAFRMSSTIIVGSGILAAFLFGAAIIKKAKAESIPEEPQLNDEISKAVDQSVNQENIMLLFS